jgi:hypothetical protein
MVGSMGAEKLPTEKKIRTFYLVENVFLYMIQKKDIFTWLPHRYGWGVGEATVEAKNGGVAPGP